MDELDQLIDEAERLPRGRDQVAILQRVVDRADAQGDVDRGFVARLRIVQATYETVDVARGLTAYAWLVARIDAEPDRFEAYAQEVGWVAKWMPGYARSHPQVPAERLLALCDDLERRHLASGWGRRQALATRIGVRLNTGLGPDLAELLADWRASARTSLTDCPMCEAAQEAKALRGLGRDDQALAALEPFLRGEIRPCGDGPGKVVGLLVPLLLERGRIEEASGLFAASVRHAEASGEDRFVETLAICASLLARTGDDRAARRMALELVPAWGRLASPDDVMSVAADLSRALAPSTADEPVRLVGSSSELGDPPAGGWTVGALRDALRARALDLASRFDARNGNAVVSEYIGSLLDAPELPEARLRSTGRPDRVQAPAPVDATAAGPADPEPAEATRPAPASDDGPDAFDRWVREQFETWRAEVSLPLLAERLADAHDDPVLAATCLSWLLGTTDDVDPDRARALVADDRLEPILQARLAAVLARTLVDAEPDPAAVGPSARPLLERALVAVTAAGVEPVAAMRVVRNVTEAALAIDASDLVERAEGVALDLDLSVPMAAFLLDATRLIAANVDRRTTAVADPDDPTLGDRTEAAALAASDVLDAAPEVLDGGVTNPVVLISVLDATSTLLELAEESPPTAPLGQALDGVPVRPETSTLVAQARMVLADAHLRLDGPAAAMVHQRQAVAATEHGGPPGLAGWARRGLGFQLEQLGRLDEALVQLAMAVDLLRAGDDPVNAWLVEAARARCLIDAGDPESAANAAEDVIAEVDELPDAPADLRAAVLEPALAAAADAELAVGGNRRALAHLERLAELRTSMGLPAIDTWASAAGCAARLGDDDRASTLFERAEETAHPDPGPQRDHDLAFVAARRSEVLWQVDRNDDAVVAAEHAAGLARAVGNDHLAAAIASVGARAHHDGFLAVAYGDEVDTADALARGDRAVDALVHAIQLLQVTEQDEMADHLGERLEDLREALDDLRS